jgi:predicted nucleic acid-binding protein
MTRVVVDASALAAVVFQEPAGAAVRERLEGAAVFAPGLLKYELASTAWKKIRRQPEDAVKILTALAVALDDRWGLTWQDLEPVDVVLVAHATGLTAYDASYLWLAGSLGADLVTLDEQVIEAAASLAA